MFYGLQGHPHDCFPQGVMYIIHNYKYIFVLHTHCIRSKGSLSFQGLWPYLQLYKILKIFCVLCSSIIILFFPVFMVNYDCIKLYKIYTGISKNQGDVGMSPNYHHPYVLPLCFIPFIILTSP